MSRTERAQPSEDRGTITLPDGVSNKAEDWFPAATFRKPALRTCLSCGAKTDPNGAIPCGH